MNNIQNNKQLSRSVIRKKEHGFMRAEKHRENLRLNRRIRREESRRSFNPVLGRPGGSDDPNRIGLSEWGVKWYLRFLKRGMEPDKARAKALEPSRNQIPPAFDLEESEDDSLRRDSSGARTQYFDSKEETMEDQTKGLTELERKLYMHYIDLHFDPDEARGKVMHQRLEQGQQSQLTDTPASNEQSDRDLEIYCQKYGLTGAERTSFMQSMQKSHQLKYAPNKGNISFRSCIEDKSLQKNHRQNITSSVDTNEATDEDQTNGIIPEDPVRAYCKLNKIQSSGRKWFLRYLKQGCDLQEAHRKLLERRALQRRLELPPEEQRKIYVWRKDSRPSTRPSTSAAAAVANNSKPPLLNNPDVHNRVTQMAVLPKEYPKQTLTEDDLAAVEDAVIEEVARGWEINLLFKGINYGPGMLLVDCENVETAKWLTHVAPQLKSWRGVTLKACPRDHIPNPHTVSIYLPNSAGKDVKSIFEAIKSQNDGIDISTWKLLNSRDNGMDQTLIFSIDQHSWETISNNQNVLRYGFGMLRVKKKY